MASRIESIVAETSTPARLLYEAATMVFRLPSPDEVTHQGKLYEWVDANPPAEIPPHGGPDVRVAFTATTDGEWVLDAVTFYTPTRFREVHVDLMGSQIGRAVLYAPGGSERAFGAVLSHFRRLWDERYSTLGSAESKLRVEYVQEAADVA